MKYISIIEIFLNNQLEICFNKKFKLEVFLNPQNENQKSGPSPDTTPNAIRPNLADSSINQNRQNLIDSDDTKENDNGDEHNPEKEYIAGEKEGDFPPDIKMNSKKLDKK